MVETVCPLCDRPRPRGVKRCICNYTFEYEPETSRAPQRRGGRGRAEAPLDLRAACIAIALLVGFVAAMLVPSDPSVTAHRELSWFLVPAGVFAACGGIFDWNWFMLNSRARRFRWLFGRSGARIVYAVLGGALAGCGAGLLLA